MRNHYVLVDLRLEKQINNGESLCCDYLNYIPTPVTGWNYMSLCSVSTLFTVLVTGTNLMGKTHLKFMFFLVVKVKHFGECKKSEKCLISFHPENMYFTMSSSQQSHWLQYRCKMHI